VSFKKSEFSVLCLCVIKGLISTSEASNVLKKRRRCAKCVECSVHLTDCTRIEKLSTKIYENDKILPKSTFRLV